jgi:DNA-binding XRE family transcriptional regulator
MWKHEIDRDRGETRPPLDETFFQFGWEVPGIPACGVGNLPPKEGPGPGAREEVEDQNGPPIRLRQGISSRHRTTLARKKAPATIGPESQGSFARAVAVWHCRDVLSSSCSVDSNEQRLSIRDLRLRTGHSQRAFAHALGVSPETYRTWDSGRRPVSLVWMEKVKTLVDEHRASTEWRSLPALAPSWVYIDGPSKRRLVAVGWPCGYPVAPSSADRVNSPHARKDFGSSASTLASPSEHDLAT